MAKSRNRPEEEHRRYEGSSWQGRRSGQGEQSWGDDDSQSQGREQQRWQGGRFGEEGQGRYGEEEQGGLGRGGMGQPGRNPDERGYGYGYGGGEGPRRYGSQGAYSSAYGAGGPDHGRFGGMGERGMGEHDYGRPGQGYGYGTGYGYGGGSQRQGDQRGFMEKAGDEVASWFGDDDAVRRRQADHRGKGPKGYRRSDDRIREDVNDRLSDDPNVDASDIEVMVESGEVTLTGHVSSRQEKRAAEDCVERVSGVSHVQNNLRVESGMQASQGLAQGERSTTQGGGLRGGSGTTQL